MGLSMMLYTLMTFGHLSSVYPSKSAIVNNSHGRVTCEKSIEIGLSKMTRNYKNPISLA